MSFVSARRAALIAAAGLLGCTAPLPSAHAADSPRLIVAFTYVTGDTLNKGGVAAPVSLTDTIGVGDTLTFTNLDPVPHTLTSPGNFDTGPIAVGTSATVGGTLVPGIYPYFCTIHGASLMSGTLIVQ